MIDLSTWEECGKSQPTNSCQQIDDKHLGVLYVDRYVKFDTFTPAAESGLPVTRVISRMKLQEILVKAVGSDIIRNGVTVVDFKDEGDKVGVTKGGRVLFGLETLASHQRLQQGRRESLHETTACTHWQEVTVMRVG